MEKFDLMELQNYFYDIGEKRWGKTLQLDVLEMVFKPVRNGKEELSLKHLRAIRDDCAFAEWWKIPDINEEDFMPFKGVFTKLKALDKEVISMLFDLIKNIEIVSCILRFIDPKNYGILSPAVENILNVKGKNQICIYLNYLQSLEELKDEYKFVRIADVDMALWTLANILNYSNLRHHPIYSDIYEAYEQRINPVKKIMARNSLNQIKEEKPLYKAELFLDSDYVTSGLIAGRELDIFVKNLCRENKIRLFERIKRRDVRYFSIPELSEKLANKKVISIDEKNYIKAWWKIRCDLTHEYEISASLDDVKEMIQGISALKEKS